MNCFSPGFYLDNVSDYDILNSNKKKSPGYLNSQIKKTDTRQE